ncbi:hypothetical protein BSK48_13210 [Paenibacillus odorifer]|uniref:hypothetical protein n=1 Tax=Paenibacillus odorifer TaxID=189426 RepID=UPI00097A4E41|nr:hypothetical protein [Paenibacillus odorifer]OMD70721.1 hypothetical protein BSK48_13210 [Paenibacillus odorifer]
MLIVMLDDVDVDVDVDVDDVGDVGDVGDVNPSERSQSQQVKTQNSGSPILGRTAVLLFFYNQ